MAQKVAFRLFRVDTFLGRGRKPIGADHSFGGAELIDFVEEVLVELQNQTMIGKPASLLHPKDFERRNPKGGDPYITVLRYRRRDRVIEAVVSSGHYGDRDYLVSSNGKSESIGDRATGNEFVVRLAFPEESSTFYMVSQIRGRSEAGTRLLDNIAYAYHLKISIVDGEGVIEKDAWYRFRSKPMIDAERFSAVTDETNVESLTLKSKGVANGRRIGEDITVTARLSKKGLKDAAMKILRQWIDNFSHNHDMHNKDGGKAVAAIFPEGYIKDNGEWDDGQITFSENNSSVTVSAETVGRLFTYTLPEGSSLQDLWNEADHRLKILSQAERINIPHVSLV